MPVLSGPVAMGVEEEPRGAPDARLRSVSPERVFARGTKRLGVGPRNVSHNLVRDLASSAGVIECRHEAPPLASTTGKPGPFSGIAANLRARICL